MSHEQLKKQVIKAIEKSPYKGAIRRVSLFGSYLHKEAKPDSDVDLLIEFSPDAIIGFFELARIQRGLAEHLKKEVDLLTPEALSPYFKSDVLKEALSLYER